jgi:phenylacetate-CoA ligase
MREMGIDPKTSSVRVLFCAGEPGFSVPATRQRLEEEWGADLHEFYGCTEAAPASGGYTCTDAVAQKNGPAATHLMADTHIWETVAPDTLRPVQRGQRGLSVVTNLFSEASPQLRFLVGDFTTLDARRCVCGRTHGRAAGGFLGRADDMLNIRGVTLFPTAIEDAVRRISELAEEFQIVVSSEHDLDVLTVKVEPRPGVSAGRYQTLQKLVETEIVSRCEVRPNIDVVPPGTLPRTDGKARRVRDLRVT